MAITRASASYGWCCILLLLLLLCLIPSCLSSLPDDCSLVVGQHTTMKLDRLNNLPGTKPGTSVLCGRILLCGLSKTKNLLKFPHVVRVNVSVEHTSIRAPNVEVCFHRNVSQLIGMCYQRHWEKVVMGSWVGYMSPFDRKIIDIRMANSSRGSIQVSIVEELFLYRIIFLVMGLILMASASYLSKSLLFYYGSAIAGGFFLVVLMVLFQGMKLLPTGRKSSIAIFLYSFMVGLVSFVLSYLPRLMQTFFLEMGINEDMHRPLAMFVAAFFLKAGAWLGFWVVHKLARNDEGNIDVSTSHFVSYAIRILAGVMILQSSLDPLLAGGALFFGVTFPSVMLEAFRMKYLFSGSLGPCWWSWVTFEGRFAGYGSKQFTRSPFSSSAQGSSTNAPSDLDTYYSTFHLTPERKKYSKEEWREFTRHSTKQALEKLVSSPDFNKWAVANAERITLRPSPPDNSNQKKRRWFKWL